MAKLSYQDASGALREHEIGDGEVTIGRHPNQSIQLLDRVVSKAHAVVRAAGAGLFELVDGGSRNGTYVNGELIQGTCGLKHGDKLTIGSTDLFFVHEVAAQPAREPVQAPKTVGLGSLAVTGPERGGGARSGTDRVTIQADGMETHIRSRLAPVDDERFLPESQIVDVGSLRRDYEKLRIAQELGASIGLEMDLEVLLEKIVDQAFAIFAADRAVILLRRDYTGEPLAGGDDPAELVPRMVRSRDGSAEVDGVRLSRTILSEILENRQAVLSSDAMMDSRFNKSHSIVLEQIRSTMSVPLLHDDVVLGVVHLDSRIARGAFTEKDLQILTGFARQAAMMIEHSRLLERMAAEIKAKEHLDRILSPQLVEEVLSGRLELERGGELRIATVMFADIRNFTTLSERLEAQQVVGLLNEYFEHMVDIIFGYEGTLDKFIGDEVMAVWGAPIARPDDAVRAVRAAHEMQAMLASYNAERSARGQRVIEIGVGMNTGEVVAGYMGSTRSMNYTVMGDTVNTAARLCSAAGPGEILIGPATWEAADGLFACEKLPPTKLKGKLEAVDIYRVLALR